MNLKKLSKESLLELQAQVKEAIKTKEDIEKKEAEKYVLELRVLSGHLCIGIGMRGNDDCRLIGMITDGGKCEILDASDRVGAYIEWRGNGKQIDKFASIDWRGGKYRIDSDFNLRKLGIRGGKIYDFEGCTSCAACEDDNIKRFSHNNRPILF